MSADVPVQYGLGKMLYHPTAGISTLLVNELARAGFPDLEGGRIRLGSGSLTSRVAPPSIVASWAGSRATGVEYGAEFPTAFQPTQPVLNSIGTDLCRIEYHVWGASAQPESISDIDVCRYLCHQLWRVIHRCAVEGSYEVESIETLGQPKSALGFQAVMTVMHRTAVPDNLIMYVQPGLTAGIAVSPVGAPPSDTITVQTGALS